MPKVEIRHCDCMEYMATLPDKAFELAIVDPPYGIFGGGQKCDNFNWVKKKVKEGDGGTWASKYNRQTSKWDFAPTEEYFMELKRVSKEQIIWGANHFGASKQFIHLVGDWDADEVLEKEVLRPINVAKGFIKKIEILKRAK